MKKHLKQGLSVFLTVVMLLTCWVFVAPSKADAITSSGSYTYRIVVAVNNTYTGNAGTYTVYGSANNGVNKQSSSVTAASGSFSCGSGTVFDNGGTTYLPSENGGTTTSFPYYCYVHTYKDSGPASSFKTDGQFNITLQVKLNGNWQDVGYKMSNLLSGHGNIDATTDKLSTSSSLWPYATTAVFNTNPSNITLPKSGNTSTYMRTYCNDQYGVRLYCNPTNSFTASVSSTGLSGTTSVYDAYSQYTLTGQSTAALLNVDSQYVTLKSSFTFNGKTVSASKQITVTDPSYTFTYRTNGGTSLSPSADVTKYYGNYPTSSQIPTSGLFPGYTFIGMFGASKTHSYAAVKPEIGNSGYTDNLSTGSQILADKTWYAAWWANNYTATFVNNDGQPLGTTTVKFDKTLEQSAALGVATIPDDPEYNRLSSTGTFNYVFDHWEVMYAEKVSGSQAANTETATEYYDIESLASDAAIIKGNVTYQAVYKAVGGPTGTDPMNQYTVTFLNQIGNTISSTAYDYRAIPTLPADRVMTANDTFTYTFKGWAVKDDVNVYIVDENNLTDDGTAIAYLGTDDTTLYRVRDDVTYIPVFEKTYKEYSVTFNYGDGIVESYEGLHWGDAVEVPVPDESYTKGGYRYTFTGWDETPSATCNGTKVYNAGYSETPAKYNISFIDYDGSTIVSYGAATNNGIEHGSLIPEATATQTYRDDDYEYTFSGWSPAFVATASSDVVYTAQYSKVDLYDINYYNDGQLVTTVKQTAGETISIPVVETPTRETDMIATYTFAFWGDEDGNNLESTTITGDLDLVANYSLDYFNYTITFLNDDGSTISTLTGLHYGDDVTIPTATKASDNTYNYTFKAWDHDVSAKCVGDDTYQASYRKAYNYYQVVFNDENGDSYSRTNYIYNERINIPVTPPETAQVSADPNYSYAFAGWKNTATGEMFKRGDKVTSAITFEPTYELVGRICTVNLYDEDGTTLLQTIEVAYNSDISDLYNEPIKLYTDAEHYTFGGWVAMDSTPASLIITDDVNLKASYVAQAHDYATITVDTAPTFFEDGTGTATCECGKTKSVDIPMLTDSIAATAKVTVAGSTWESGDTIDFSDSIFVAPNNNIIINTADTGDVGTYNPLGNGSGIRSISYSVQEAQADPTGITAWTQSFDYDLLSEEEKADVNRRANATGKLYNISLPDGSSLADGAAYIVYVKIVDLIGNVSYASTGTLSYDTQAPTIDITSTASYYTRYCVDATINAADNNELASVTLNGTEITVPMTVTDAGLYQVIAVDSAGNETKSNFEVKGSHTITTYTVPPTCTEDGYTVDRCSVCGNLIGERTVITATGHHYDEGVYTAPTCTQDGYWTYTCAENDDSYVVADTGSSTGEHTYVETVRVDPTCSATGTATYVCSVCGDTYTDILPIDPDAHRWYRGVVTKPTCTEQGYTTFTCKYDASHVRVDNYTDPTGHTPSGEWVVTLEPTCTEVGTRVQYCKNCDTTEVQLTEDIAALGHFYTAVVTPPTSTEQGYTTYTCARCGDTYVGDYVDPYAQYDVTFLDEDGTEIAAIENKLEGETITAGEVTEPTKASDETYRYSFSHWVDGDGNQYTLPLTISDTLDEQTTLTAVYTERYVNYTVTLYNEDGTTQYKKIGYQHYGDTLTVAEGPAKADTAGSTFTFLGWTADGITASKDIEIDGDITLRAMYEETPKTFKVVYAYDVDHVLQSMDVTAGQDAVYTGETPVKDYDATNHYTFTGWSASTDDVYANIFVTPVFTATAHDYTILVSSTEATCTDASTATYQCACAAEKTIVGEALGHIYSGVTKTVDGKIYKVCDRCGEIIDAMPSHTITFLDYNGQKIAKKGYQQEGTVVATPDDPTRASDKYYDYTFIGWAVDGTTDIVTDFTVGTADVTYVAMYSKTIIEYTVVFAYDSANIIATVTVEAGTPAVCPVTPTKAATADGHYVFSGWSQNVTAVTSSMYVTPKFNLVAHNFGASVNTPATCTCQAFNTRVCDDCGYAQSTYYGDYAEHTWDSGVVIDGKTVYTCQVCGATKSDDVLYTVIFKNDDGSQIKRISYLIYGNAITPPADPTKAADAINTYEFAGWVLEGDDEIVTDFTVVDNAVYVAKYTATQRTYNVIFAYDADNVIYIARDVPAGTAATFAGTTPTKAYTATEHYVFSGWSESISNITKDTYVTPEFTAEAHNNVYVNTIAATCTEGELLHYACACGYEHNENGTAPALGHDWADPVTVNDETTRTCRRCGEVEVLTNLFTVTFLNEDGSQIKKVGYLQYGDDLTSKLPATPTKASDTQYDYTFAGWSPTLSTTVTGNATYTATYTKTVRNFKVIFAIDAEHVLQVLTVKGGESATYTGATPDNGLYDNNGHYVFSGWSADTSVVSSDMYVIAKFTKVAHTMTNAPIAATCTEGAGTKYSCSDCGYSYVVTTGKPLGHSWSLVDSKQPTHSEAGYEHYVCDRCGEEKTIVLDVKDYVYITLNLKNQNGSPASDVRVSLYSGDTFVVSGYTDSNGSVTLRVPEAGDYNVVIDGTNVTRVTSTITVNKDGTVDQSKIPAITIEKCNCSCHLNTLWGTIFRFFHKIIKFLVGDFRCCKDPDARYYS